MTTNEQDGNWVLFSQNYTALGALPSNVFQGLPTSPYEANTSYGYNDTWDSVTFNKTTSEVGELYIAGLYPCAQSTYHVYLRFERDDHNAYSYLFIGNTMIYYRLYTTNAIRVICYYYSDAGVLTATSTVTEPVNPDRSIHLYVDQHPSNQTVHVYTNITSVAWLPYYAREDRLVGYSAPPKSYVRLTTNIASGTYGQTHLFLLEQWVPKNFLTVYALNDKQPFGLDGTHDWDTIVNGTEYINSTGGSGTLWLDESMDWWDTPSVVANLTNLLDNCSWELGIHYSTQLTSLTYSQAINLMQCEYDNVTAKFGRTPSSWCSLQNADNYTHAAWAYTNLNMVWRNGPSGIKGEVNIGNLCDNTGWEMWESSLGTGFVMPCFTHETDLDPAISYSISYANFTYWVDNYSDLGISISPFAEWFNLARNTADATFSDISAAASSLSFSYDSNGNDSLLRIHWPFILPGTTGNCTINPDGYTDCYIGEGDFTTGIVAVSSEYLNATSDLFDASVTTSGTTMARWTVYPASVSQSIAFVVGGLDDNTGYKVYQDGVVIATGTGPSFSFTATGGGEFEVVVWNNATITTLQVLTINMIGLGILVSVVTGWVMPFARNIKNGSYSTADKMMKELMRGVTFIIVGCTMYGILWQVMIG